MKNSFAKFLGILLCAAMVIGMIPSGFVIAANEPSQIYYAKFGGTGDGSSAESPLGSLKAAVEKINADGFTAGDTVTVKVIKYEGEPTDGKWDSADDSVWLQYSGVPNHMATIVYESYDEADKSSFAFSNNWEASGAGVHLVLMGPTVFNNIKVIDNRTDGSGRDIYAQNYDFTLTDSVELLKNNKNTGYALQKWNSHFMYSSNRNGVGSLGSGGTVSIDVIDQIADFALSGYGDASNQGCMTINGDVTAKLGAGTLAELKLDATKANVGISTHFTGNVNLVLNGTQITKYVSNNVPTIDGAYQVIYNNGAKITTDSANGLVNQRKYILTPQNGISLDVTGNAGEYAVSGGMAYTASADGSTITYGDSILKVAEPGEYTVKTAESVEAIKSTETAPERSGYVFSGWSDDGAGTLTANYVQKSDKYYVKYGGTGDGRSVDNPAATITEVIKTINADGFGAGDEVTVYAIQSDDWDYGTGVLEIGQKDGTRLAPEHHITSWGPGASYTLHTATVNITSYDPENPTYLAATQKLGENNRMIVGGPTNFSNIVLIDMRGGLREFSANGFDVTYGEGTVFAKINHDEYNNPAKAWDGAINLNGSPNLPIGDAYKPNTGAGGTVRFNSAFVAKANNDRGVFIASGASGNSDKNSQNFTNNVKIYFDNSEIDSYIRWGASGSDTITTTFGAGLSVIVNNAKSLINGKDEVGPVSITDYVVICNNGTSFPNPPAYVTAERTWKLNLTKDAGGTLDVSDSAGVFAADTEYANYSATNTETGETVFGNVQDGKISLEPGEYSISFTDEQEAYCGKQIVKISDAGSNFESNAGDAYLSENTTLYGQPVRKIWRNPEVADDAAGSVRPLLYKYDSLIDENGSRVQLKNARYLTVKYYYESSDDSPVLSGKSLAWTQGKLTETGSTWNGEAISSANYSGAAPKTYAANSWNTVTIDLWTNSAYKNNVLSHPEYTLAQYKFSFLAGLPSGTALGQNDVLYIGDYIFTSYDPADMLKNRDLVFISETGSDTNDGSSPSLAVASIARAYELAKESEKAAFVINGKVAVGNISGIYPNLDVTISAEPNAAEAFIDGEFIIASNVVFDNVSASGITVANGFSAVFNRNFKDAQTVKAEDGKAEFLNGSIAKIIVAGEAANSSSLVVDGAEIGEMLFDSDAKIITVGYVSGKINNVSGVDGRSVGDLQLLLGSGMDKPQGFDAINVSGEKLTVIPPRMKASSGESFAVNGTSEFGVFETYSGSAYNFGYGLTTYICYTYNTDKTKVYYSNENTGYKLTLPESGTYELEIAGEKTYTAANGKVITGFSTDDLVLPEGAAGWNDNGKGIIEAAVGGTPSEEEKTVYVSNKYGADTNDGLTSEKALKTLAKAISVIGTSNNGTVVVLDGKDSSGNREYTVYTRVNGNNNASSDQDVLMYSGVPAHTGTITYVGDAVDSVICYGFNHFELKGPSVFRDISLIEGVNTGKGFITNGHDVSFEGTVKYIRTGLVAAGGTAQPNGNLNESSSNKLELDVSGRNQVTDTGRIVINDCGTPFNSIGFGGWDNDITIGGNQTVEINGGSVGKIKLRNNKGSWNMQNLNVVYNGGSVGGIADNHSGTGTAAVKAIQIVNNNGLSAAYTPTGMTVTDGTWIMNSASAAGCSLDVTETAGTFAVKGGKNARAVNGDRVVYSSGEFLTVDAGTWDITYVDNRPYDFDGSVFTAHENLNINLNTISVAAPENKLFIGWSSDAAGTQWLSSVEKTFAAEEKVYAQFIDFNTAVGGNLSILGAQIRLASGETTQGLRFVTRADKSLLTDLGVSQIGGEGVSYGTVVFPADLLGNAELVIGAADESGKYIAAKVPAVKTYGETDGNVSYTAVITGISGKNYIRDYAARSYIEYTDKNGAARVAYGEKYAVSIHAIADYALKNDNKLTDEQKAVLNGILKEVTAALDAPVSTLYGSPEYSAATEEQFANGEVFYTTASGMKVREIHIKGGANSAASETTLGVITDTHINVVDPELDKYDPEVQYTNQTRTWCKNGATISNLEKAVGHASMYDGMIITGDIIDYLALGSLETVKRIAFDPYPDELYVLGGHDTTKNMETGFGDKLSLETRQEILRNYWPHDILYTSKVVNNNVMCIQIDNGQSRYWQEQVAKLEADIQTARDNGYIILLFQHEPVKAGDAADGAVSAYDDANQTYDFWQGGNILKSNSNPDSATQQIYDLITANGDIIRGVFCGHIHYTYTSGIKAKTADGADVTIPIYINRSNAYDSSGFVTKIVVDAAK